MKIKGVGPTGGGIQPPNKKGPKTTDKSFASVLKETSTKPAQKSSTVSTPHPVTPAQQTGDVGKPLRAKAIRQVETALSDLEFYINTLSNNDVPLARLTPMSDALMERKDDLVSMLPHIDDAEMREIITQTATLIINENSRLHLAGGGN